MKLQDAYKIAEKVKKQLEPHCDKIRIAGSIRRKKPEVKDVEIVCIPKPFTPSQPADLFDAHEGTGIAKVANQWKLIKGKLPGKYIQYMLPEGIKLDLFILNPNNWGYLFAVRTGPAEYSRDVIIQGLKRRGYTCKDGHVFMRGHMQPIQSEKKLFELIGITYKLPENRMKINY